MNNPDHTSESLETIFWDKILKFLDPESEKEKLRIRDPGWQKIRSPDPQHCQYVWKKNDEGMFLKD
jgi:hypothetical protein